MKNVTEAVHICYKFTTVYCPWANGTMERLCKEVIRSVRAVLLEWRMPMQEWPSVIKAVQGVLSHSLLKQLGHCNDDTGDKV